MTRSWYSREESVDVDILIVVLGRQIQSRPSRVDQADRGLFDGKEGRAGELSDPSHGKGSFKTLNKRVELRLQQYPLGYPGSGAVHDGVTAVA